MASGNRTPIRYAFHSGVKAIRYNGNMAYKFNMHIERLVHLHDLNLKLNKGITIKLIFNL